MFDIESKCVSIVVILWIFSFVFCISYAVMGMHQFQPQNIPTQSVHNGISIGKMSNFSLARSFFSSYFSSPFSVGPFHRIHFCGYNVRFTYCIFQSMANKKMCACAHAQYWVLRRAWCHCSKMYKAALDCMNWNGAKENTKKKKKKKNKTILKNRKCHYKC